MTRRVFAAGGLVTMLGGATKSETRLFVDDHFVTRKHGVRRVVHPATRRDAPVLTAERPWEVQRVYHGGTVLRDPATGRFRCGTCRG